MNKLKTVRILGLAGAFMIAISHAVNGDFVSAAGVVSSALASSAVITGDGSDG